MTYPWDWEQPIIQLYLAPRFASVSPDDTRSISLEYDTEPETFGDCLKELYDLTGDPNILAEINRKQEQGLVKDLDGELVLFTWPNIPLTDEMITMRDQKGNPIGISYDAVEDAAYEVIDATPDMDWRDVRDA